MRTLFMSTTVVCLCIASPSVAWDQHHLMTSQLIVGFKDREPALWHTLERAVEVAPLERFLSKAFGPSCTWDLARDTVFEGVGRGYQVLYVDEMRYGIEVVWEKGLSRQLNLPVSHAGSQQALGEWATARDVLAVYSDEPDWGLDDDVPRLRGKGVSQAGEGMATRMLRHFWYQGEREAGVDFGKDQETDRRAQLFYELALVAFAEDEPYWGYRFLANSLHYLQDVTQPFHTRPVLTSRMLNMLDVVRAKLCELSPHPSCAGHPSLDAEILSNAWIVAAYHATFEDFSRGLLSPGLPYSSQEFLIDPNGWHERNEGVETLPWRESGPLLDLRQVIPAEQRAINARARAVGEDAYAAFGPKIRYHLATTQETIRLTSNDGSEGFQLSLLSPSRESNIPTTGRQDKALPLLVKEIHGLFLRAGVWGRELVREALSQSEAGDEPTKAAVNELRARFERRCAGADFHVARP